MTNWSRYNEYIKVTPGVVARFGGRFIVRGGETVTLDPNGPLADAAWAKQRLGRVTQALPNRVPRRFRTVDLIRFTSGMEGMAWRSVVGSSPRSFGKKRSRR